MGSPVRWTWCGEVVHAACQAGGVTAQRVVFPLRGVPAPDEDAAADAA